MVFSDVDNNGEIDVTIPTVEVMETHTYYPFGMKIEGMESIEACPVYQPYGYNGKEKLLPDVYDYGARMYMASIGRWTSVDPLAEAYYGISSYVYALNDPISKLDPNGMWVESPSGFYSDNPEEISALFNFLDTQEDDPPVKKDDIDWKQAGKDFVYGIPGVGPALSSGDKLEGGDYIGAAADFGIAISEMATLGYGAKIVSFASRQLAKFGAKGVTNAMPKGNLANHLFKGTGKLVDNPANRALITKISNGKPLVVDKFGKSWYRGVDTSGKGIYSYTQNGVVKGAGYTNLSAAEIIVKYGVK